MLVFICIYNQITRETILYAAFSLALPFIFNASKNWKWDRWIGELSYPVYISHISVLMVCRTLPAKLEPTTLAWIYLPVLLLVSAGLVLAIDTPVERWRQRRVRRSALREMPVSIGAL